MSDYNKKLQDPRWKAKRLEILTRDNFQCLKCSRKNVVLQVHHTRYKGEPWECPNKYLVTVCKGCHAKIHNIEKSKHTSKNKHQKVDTLNDIKIKVLKEMEHSCHKHLNLLCYLITNLNNGHLFRKDINDKHFGDYIRKNPNELSDSIYFLIEDKCLDQVKKCSGIIYYKLSSDFNKCSIPKKVRRVNERIINYYNSQIN
jgi:hypothetical protein